MRSEIVLYVVGILSCIEQSSLPEPWVCRIVDTVDCCCRTIICSQIVCYAIVNIVEFVVVIVDVFVFIDVIDVIVGSMATLCEVVVS